MRYEYQVLYLIRNIFQSPHGMNSAEKLLLNTLIITLPTLIFLNVQFQPSRYCIKFRLSRKLPTFITESRHIYILIIAQKLVY